MCGFIGIATAREAQPSVDEHTFLAMRDAMSHRGPDDAGAFQDEHVWLGHRRLTVIDTSEQGHQPMHTPPGAGGASRFTIVYNGELYNDSEIREELKARGVRLSSTCDTETFLHAFATWGVEALWRVRGMFSVAIYDRDLRTLTLARDPLGIKPLYYAFTGTELVFASEAHAVASHPGVGKRPNWRMVSAYLTTIRTVLGEHTLYEGVRYLRAGQLMQCDLSGSRPVARVVDWWQSVRAQHEGQRSFDEAADDVQTTLTDSVRRHLRSDVPLCALLSGGLDSTITTSIAHDRLDALRTYAAGHDTGPEADLAHARRVAEEFGTRHEEAIIDEGGFREAWQRMIVAQGLPLSTPNEVAINAVAARLREDGCVVTLSGEGADELFGGYEKPLAAASRYIAGELQASGPGAFELASNAWVPVEAKPQLLRPDVWASVGHDEWLTSWYEDEFTAVSEEAGLDDNPDRLQAHLRFLRRVNLCGLLQRLDSATMLASVEGRTPFADVGVTMLAEALPSAHKFDPSGEPPANTKRVLRAAFADRVPDHVMHRDKASFPLPFTSWMGGHEDAVRSSALLAELMDPGVVELVATRPEEVWNVAWPAINLALWGHTLDSPSA